MNVLLRFKLSSLLVVALGLIFSFYSHGADIIRDPTAPLVGLSGVARNIDNNEDSKKTNTSLILQGVLIENGRKIAVINNRLLRVGEEIEGYKVISIVDYGADLSLEEETLSLSLISEKIKISNE